MVYEYYDGFVEEVTVNVNGKIYSTEGYKKDLNDRINDYLNKDESLYDLDELNSFIIQAKNYGIPQETMNLHLVSLHLVNLRLVNLHLVNLHLVNLHLVSLHQGGDSQEGNEGEPTQGGINSGLQSNGARYYQYYLRYTNQSEHIAQHQINGKDSVKKDIDAQNGGGFPEEETISLQIIPKPIDFNIIRHNIFCSV